MEWEDEGYVLAVRRHGESSAIVSLLTAEHGRHAGLVRGGQSRKNRGLLQPGNRVSVTWRARLEEHLGSFTLELQSSAVAAILNAPGRLAALSSAVTLIEQTLPERELSRGMFDMFNTLMDALDGDHWAATYVVWELNLMMEIGFGLDLSECAATGTTEDLIYVSPKSGRAVCRAAGEAYKDKLLVLPAFLLGAEEASSLDIANGLALSGFFLERHVFGPRQRNLPDTRRRLAEKFSIE
ncbi:MAG: DNA repair protein RecO [Rhodospirillaceae bacterium]|nr:DNA repair protein RecO [Rhodospirillaceae bacterium]|tara:strand:- start:610 stop:1326 length:717 start_codon:yes stop_codon:yes gene_type:complete